MKKIAVKKALACLLTIVLTAGILPLSGCAKKEVDTNHIVIWHDKEDAVVEVLQAAFAEALPDVTVELVRKDGLTEALKLVGNDPSAAPDLYLFAHDKIGVYAELGILAPITDFVDEETLANYLPVTLESATYKDTLYQLPLYFETLLFLYNKDLMSESEVPQTTEALYAYMQANTADGHFGFVEQHSTAYYSIPWINGFGGELITADGVPQLTSSEVRAALKYHQKFLEYMPGESEYSTVNTLFLEGMADSTIGGPWLVPSAREAGIDLGFATMPVVDETGLPLAPYTGVQGVHVLKVAAETKHDTIARVLNVLTDPQVGIDLANASGCAPANILAYDDPSVSEDPMVTTMREIAETAQPMPNIPQMDVMWTVLGNLLVAVNLSGGVVETETTKYQAKAEQLIEA
ncbi:MAG: extracellular solute-binding protein, partial [Clostridiaceae bacterium]